MNLDIIGFAKLAADAFALEDPVSFGKDVIILETAEKDWKSGRLNAYTEEQVDTLLNAATRTMQVACGIMKTRPQDVMQIWKENIA